MRIDEANELTLRPAFEVVAQIDIDTKEAMQISTSRAYNTGAHLDETIPQPTLMDLSGGGFLSDGNAIPLGDNEPFAVSQIGEDLIISSISESVTARLILHGYIDGVPHKWESSRLTGSTRYVTIPASQSRIIVVSAVLGDYSWRFDNNNLVSINGVLRGVETKVENPELQLSEIEIKGYEPNDITDIIGQIGNDYPIRYTTGYQGDMSPVRTFYMSDAIEWEDNVITIKGQDATKFLDGEIADYQGDIRGFNGGIFRYHERIAQAMDDAGVSVERIEYDLDLETSNTFSAFLLPKISARKMIARAVNLLRLDLYGDYPVYLNYVDAGSPHLWTGKSDTVKELKLISRPKVSVEPNISTIQMLNPIAWALDSEEAQIEQFKMTGEQIKETTDPYYSFSSSAGSITQLSPYAYKIKRTGNVTISGIKLDIYYTNDETASPTTVTNGETGVTVELDEFIGLKYTTFNAPDDDYYFSMYDALENLLTRSNLLYEFEYRGDPNLNPRDYIKADIDGSGTLVEMTIESIDFSHEDGGYKQTITARKGLI